MNRLVRFLPTILAVFSMGVVTPAAEEDKGLTLFDFSKPDAARAWQPFNDGVMGGVSDRRFRITHRGRCVTATRSTGGLHTPE